MVGGQHGAKVQHLVLGVVHEAEVEHGVEVQHVLLVCI